jgi:hypothetical protein
MASTSQQTKKYWLEHIEFWQSSDLSQAAYCRQHGLVTRQFSYWKRKLVTAVEKTPQLKTPSSAFACVQVEPTTYPDFGLTLQFADGTRLGGIQQTNVLTVCQLIEVLK